MTEQSIKTLGRMKTLREMCELVARENWRFDSYGGRDFDTLVCDLPDCDEPTPVLEAVELGDDEVTRNWTWLFNAIHSDLPAMIDLADDLRGLLRRIYVAYAHDEPTDTSLDDAMKEAAEVVKGGHGGE